MWAFSVTVLVVNLAPLALLARISFPRFSARPSWAESFASLKSEIQMPKIDLDTLGIEMQLAQSSKFMKDAEYGINSKPFDFEIPQKYQDKDFSSNFNSDAELFRPYHKQFKSDEKLLAEVAEVKGLLNGIMSGKIDPNLIPLNPVPGKSGIWFIKKTKPSTSEADLAGSKSKPGEPETDLVEPKRGLGDREVALAVPKRGLGESEADFAEMKRVLGESEADLMGSKREPGKQDENLLESKHEPESNLAARKSERSELEVPKSSSKVKPRKPEVKPETQSRTKQVLKAIKKKLKKKMKKELKKCVKKIAKEVWKKYKDADNATTVSDEQLYQEILKKAIKKCVKKKAEEITETTTWSVTEVPDYVSSTTGYKAKSVIQTNETNLPGHQARWGTVTEPGPASRGHLVAIIFAGLFGFAAVLVVWAMVFMRRRQRRTARAHTKGSSKTKEKTRKIDYIALRDI